jgi:magnesium chelatase family protein
LARRVVHLLPAPDPERRLALAQVEAAHGRLRTLPQVAPLRAPHPSTSAQSLLGGGHPLRPGELSRAHGGVLFLDELPEFARPVLEGLRQPLEEREVRVQRARESATFPADALLVATSNPCPCGNFTHPRLPCRCTPARLHAYRARLSGPLVDRFDLFVEMGPVAPEVVDGPPTPPCDEDVHARLRRARAFQQEALADRGFLVAGDATLECLQRLPAESGTRALLHRAAEELALSGRGLLRCMRVARTAADLAVRERLEREDVLLALSLRPPAAGAGTTTATSPAAPRAGSLRTAGRAARSRRDS